MVQCASSQFSAARASTCSGTERLIAGCGASAITAFTTGKVNVGIEIENQYTIHKSDRPTLLQNLLGGDSFIAFLPPDDEQWMMRAS